MSDDQKQDIDPKIDREGGDDNLETEGYVKPNVDGTGELDEDRKPPQGQDS